MRRKSRKSYLLELPDISDRVGSNGPGDGKKSWKWWRKQSHIYRQDWAVEILQIQDEVLTEMGNISDDKMPGESNQVNDNPKKLETYVKQLETECGLLRECLALAEETLGKALAEMGKDSVVDANTVEGDLLAHSEEWLKDSAADFHLSVEDGIPKEALAHELACYMLDPVNMRKEFFWYSEDELDAFERLAECGPFIPSQEEKEKLDEFWDNIGYVVVYTDGTYQIVPDAREVYEYICKTGYRDLHRQVRWLKACLDAFVRIYVAAPVKILHRMYRREVNLRLSYQDFLKLLGEFPDEINPCQMIDGYMIQKEFVSVCPPYQLFDEMLFDTDYYIPSKEEIMDYAENGYPSRQGAYQELWNFANTDLKLPPDECSKLCVTIQRLVYEPGFLQEAQHIKVDSMINFTSVSAAEKFSDIVRKLNEITRMPYLRGHTQREMLQKQLLPIVGVYPTISKHGKDVSVVLADARLYR